MSGAVDISADVLRKHPSGPVRAAEGTHRDDARPIDIAAGPGDQAGISARERDEHDGALGFERVSDRRRGLVSQQFRKRRRIDQPSNNRIIGVDGGRRKVAG
jgi:hypothetical protein